MIDDEPSVRVTEKKLAIVRANNRDYQEQVAKDIRRLGIEKETLKKENERLRSEIALKMAPVYGAGADKTPALARRRRLLEQRRQTLSKLEKELAEERAKGRQSTLSADHHRELLAKSRGDPKLKDSGRALSVLSGSRGMDDGVHSTAPEETYITVNSTRDAHVRVERQVRVLENRLDRALVRFNEALHANKVLREQIDNLRRERGVFDQIYERLERELQEKKKEMAFIIEVSNVAYEEKDNAVTELDQLKLYAKKEMNSFQETFAELDELLEEDGKVKEAVKGRMAVISKSIADAKAKEKQRKQEPAQVQQTQVRQQSESAGMTLQMYEDALDRIRAAKRCDDIGKLVSSFEHSEDDNFSLFNYVNELNGEMDRLEKERDQLIQDIEDARGHVRDDDERARQRTLHELEGHLREAEAQNLKYTTAAEETHRTLEAIGALVEVVFTRLNCPLEGIVAVSGQAEKGTPAPLNTENLSCYLGAIEMRTEEYLGMWYLQTVRETGAAPQILRGPVHAHNDRPLNPDVPGAGDDFGDGDDDDEGMRVMTRDELVVKSEKRLKQLQLQQEKAKHGARGWGGKPKAKPTR